MQLGVAVCKRRTAVKNNREGTIKDVVIGIIALLFLEHLCYFLD